MSERELHWPVPPPYLAVEHYNEFLKLDLTEKEKNELIEI